MITSELVRHISRELHFSETELQGHAEKLEITGMLDGDDISRATVLLIAAATGDGAGGIADRVKVRADMNVAETTLAFRDGKTEVRRCAVSEYQDAEEEPLCRPFGGFVRDQLQRDVNGHPPYGRILSISLSRSRPVGIVETASKYRETPPAIEITLFADIPRSLLESGATVEIPELITGMEATTIINGDVLQAVSVLIRADKEVAAA